jgi:hypothetical protein
MSQIEFSLLPRSGPAPQRLDPPPEQLAAWLENLPQANIPQCARLVKLWLTASNQLNLPAATRLACLQRLGPLCGEWCTVLAGEYRDGLLPQTGKAGERAALVQSLLEEQATGFKLVAMTSMLGASPMAHLKAAMQQDADRPFVEALYQVVRLTAQRLVECYLAYAPEPAGAWLDLHRAYRFAEEHFLHLQPVNLEGGQDTTISHAYKQILLLALCNPYHLLPGETVLLYRHMGGWAGKARLLKMHHDHPNRFLIDLATDAAPRRVQISGANVSAEAGRSLDTAQFTGLITAHIARLREAIAQHPGGRCPLASRLELALYQRLSEHWEVRQNRREQRRRQHAPVTIASGLGACHHHLAGGAAFDPEAELQRQTRPAAGRHNTEAASDETFIAQPQAPVYNSHPWRLGDESPGGLAIYCVEDCRARVQVGELVVCQREGDPAWRLGVIRWLKAGAPGVRLGIRLFGRDAHALAVRALSGPGAGGAWSRALFLESRGGGQGTLILPAGIYDLGSVLQVVGANGVSRLKLTRLAEASRVYAQFRFDRQHESHE